MASTNSAIERREAPPTYTAAEERWFESLEQFQNALGSEEGQPAAGKVANLATGGAPILVCEVQG